MLNQKITVCVESWIAGDQPQLQTLSREELVIFQNQLLALAGLVAATAALRDAERGEGKPFVFQPVSRPPAWDK